MTDSHGGDPRTRPASPPPAAGAAGVPPFATAPPWPSAAPFPIVAPRPAGISGPAATRPARPPLGALLPVRAWLHDPSLRSWPVRLFVLLVCAPSVALVLLTGSGSYSSITWAFAGYFAVAWLLLLWGVVRPAHVHLGMLASVLVVCLFTQVPLAVWLERSLHATTSNVVVATFTVGLPEELAKALPILVLAYLFRSRWQALEPKDYLMLGALSGLVFGCSEVVHYVSSVYLPLLVVGNMPMSSFLLQVVWRLLTDSVTHATWAGISCYFVGLGLRHPSSRWWLFGFGLLLASVLHGINDTVAGHWPWVAVTLVSVVLFLAYAQAGGTVEQRVGMAEAGARGPGGDGLRPGADGGA
jgi:RsiW-degrading membrane proteinase PrsW (M82 family)